MANTYTLISSNVLTSSAASVTFSAIPSTYTDLVLRVSARNVAAGDGISSYYITYNGSSSSDYSLTSLYTIGPSFTGSSNNTAQTQHSGYINQNGNTADTFSSDEIYIPNYAGATNKPASYFGVAENNSGADFKFAISARAFLRSNTAAITSITLSGAGTNLVSGSSFYLYGLSS